MNGEWNIKEGFDQGPKLSNWKEVLEELGIEVVRDVLREEAADVLRAYQSSGGLIYNALFFNYYYL